MRTYTVGDLEQISGLTRRTIGDYTSKGLLAGPSHRGRGARYSQADVDALTVIPRLRTHMKQEFQSLRAVSRFMSQLSMHDLHTLAIQTDERSFVLQARKLRVRISIAALLPQVSPEKLAEVLNRLTPEQIRGVDTGRYQIGAVVDLSELLSADSSANPNTSSGDELDPEATDSWEISEVVAQARAAAAEPEVLAQPDRLADIAERLERLEKLLATET